MAKKSVIRLRTYFGNQYGESLGCYVLDFYLFKLVLKPIKFIRNDAKCRMFNQRNL